jgi:hypothetical protein
VQPPQLVTAGRGDRVRRGAAVAEASAVDARRARVKAQHREYAELKVRAIVSGALGALAMCCRCR